MNVLKKWLIGGCVYYTLLSLLFLILDAALSGSASRGPTISFFWLSVPVALCFSLARLVYRVGTLPRYARILLHFALCVLSVFLLLWIPYSVNSADTRASRNFIAFLVIVAVYWLGFFAVRLCGKLVQKIIGRS